MQKLKIKNSIAIITFAAGFLLMATTASAHVVVRPAEVGAAAFQTFTVGVPNEKDNPTVAVRLIVPDGLNHVSPNVKPGWRIETKKSGEGEEAKVNEISWTGGSIPAGQRDDFFFSAQVPANQGSIIWKAYQTYSDGEIVSWDQDPNAAKEDSHHGEEQPTTPYSQTKVVNDLKPTTSNQQSVSSSRQGMDSMTLALASMALILSGVSIWMQLKSKKS